MECEVKHHPADHLYILPIPQGSGSLSTLSCRECADELGMFCPVHDQIYARFCDDSTLACYTCIHHEVDDRSNEADQCLARLREHLPESEFDLLRRYCQSTAGLGEGLARRVLRELITRAHRSRIVVSTILDEACEQHLIDPIVIRLSAELAA